MIKTKEKKKVGRMFRFLRFCAFLVIVFFTGNVMAAGYTCSTTAYKKYTSCKAGYELTLNGVYNATPTVGNACTKCVNGGGGGTAKCNVITTVTCAAGQYLDGTTCKDCASGYYCPSTSVTYTPNSGIQGRLTCPAGYTKSASKTTSESGCYLTTTAGKYIATAKSSEQTTCPAGSYCPSMNVYYGNSGANGGGLNACPAVDSTTIDPFTASGDSFKWVKEACPAATESNIMVTAKLSTWDSRKGMSNINNCAVNYTLTTPCGTIVKETVTYNSAMNQYYTWGSGGEVGNRYYTTLEPGYYLSDQLSSTYCNTSTNRMLYKRAVTCPGGGIYCPGFTSGMPLCNSTDWTYGSAIGLYGCETGTSTPTTAYWKTPTGATKRSQCYVDMILDKNGGSGAIPGNSTATGTTNGVKTCYYGTECTLPNTYYLNFGVPTGLMQSGYRFVGGWGTDSSCMSDSTTINLTTSVSPADGGAAKVFACKTRAWNVTLNGNGATTSGQSVIYVAHGLGAYRDSGMFEEIGTDSNPITKPARSYKISYNTQGGNTVSDSTAAYSFEGYYSGDVQQITSDGYFANETVRTNLINASTSSATYTAKWTQKSVTLPTPTRANSTFHAWNTKADASGVSVGSPYTPTTDITLYALWNCNAGYVPNADNTACVPGKYTITLDNANATINGTSSIYFKKDTAIYLDSNATQVMTETANPISVPSRGYDVAYEANGGTVSIGSANGWAGYKFDGYYTNNGYQIILPSGYVDNVQSGYITSTQTADLTLTARWTGGSVTLPAPSRTGYTFAGWYSDSALTNKVGDAGASYTPGKVGVTLYAKWTPKLLTITLNNAGATVYGASSVYFKPGLDMYLDSNATQVMTETANPIAVPSRGYDVAYEANGGTVSIGSANGWAGYTFDGYYTNNGYQIILPSGYVANEQSGYITSTQTADLTLTARWTGGSVTLPAPSRTGYTFAGWYSDSALTNKVGDAGASYTPGKDGVTLYAKWTPITYTVAYNANKPSQASASVAGTTSSSTHTYDEAKVLTSNAYSLTGWNFVGWNTKADGKGTTYTNGSTVKNLSATNGATVTLYAMWKPVERTILLGGPSSGYGPIYTRYDYGAYSDEARTKLMTTTTNPIDVPADMTYTVTFSSNGGTDVENLVSTSAFIGFVNSGGEVLLAPTGYITDAGIMVAKQRDGDATYWYRHYGVYSAITLPAPSRTGYTFAGWYSDSTLTNKVGDAGASYTPGKDGVTLYAKWTPNTYTVVYNANGGTGTMASGIHTYDVAKALTANAFTNGIKQFLGWSTDKNATTAMYTNNQSVTNLVSTNGSTVTLYAVWGDCPACAAGTGAECTLSAPLGVCTYTTSCKTGYNTLVNDGKYNPSCTLSTYTIKYYDGPAEITGLTPVTYDVTTATFDLPIAYKSGSEFVGWYTDSALTSSVVTQIASGTTGDMVYYAKWSTCPAGSVCDGDSVVTCPAGSYCAAGSSSAVPCAKGSYSTGGATTCTLADAGYYVDTEGAVEQIACPMGTYGSTKGLTSAECSGKCTAGYYGSATAQTVATCSGLCSAGYYCPEGSTSAKEYSCNTDMFCSEENQFWTSDPGATKKTSCYGTIHLAKQIMSGDTKWVKGLLTLPENSGCKSLESSADSHIDKLQIWYGTKCMLPTNILTGYVHNTHIKTTGEWMINGDRDPDSGIDSITQTHCGLNLVDYMEPKKLFSCDPGYHYTYVQDRTFESVCVKCESPYYCPGVKDNPDLFGEEGLYECSALDSTKTDGVYSSVAPFDSSKTCRFTQEQQAVPQYCETKISNTVSYTGTEWEDNTYSVTAKSGAFVFENNTVGATCDLCRAGTYCANGEAAVCGNNQYSDEGASACEPCATDSGYGNSGSSAADHAGVSSCKVTCDAGQYVENAGAGCVDVTANYWGVGGIVAQNATLNRTACPTGLTTCGSGLCANEAGDCGRKLHAGDKIIHLRSVKRTAPALHVVYGDQKLYGNLVAPRSGTLKVANGGITYSVVSDEQ